MNLSAQHRCSRDRGPDALIAIALGFLAIGLIIAAPFFAG